VGRNKATHCKRGHERTPENLYKNNGCKVCGKLQATQYMLDHPETGRKTKYGISKEEFERRLHEQNNRCAICGDEFSETLKPCVDHGS
jgi:hypothetical protein